MYCYPEEIDDDLIQSIKTLPKVCHYLDMPIQHCSDAILKKMGRHTCRKDLEDGVGYSLAELAKSEKEAFIANYLPIGIQQHYDILTKLDASTYYKLLAIIEKPQLLRWLIVLVKIIYRLNKC